MSLKKEILTLKTVGIVAEYNPFHNGHKYQIEQIRKHTNTDNIVIVMSGNFVQRGGLAWTDKYLRAKAINVMLILYLKFPLFLPVPVPQILP